MSNVHVYLESFPIKSQYNVQGNIK